VLQEPDLGVLVEKCWRRWELAKNSREIPLRNSREVVEAAGVELKGLDLVKALMVQDFWWSPLKMLWFTATLRLR
jgi:hypothetical protein